MYDLTKYQCISYQVHMCTLLFQAGCQRPMSGPIHGQVMACISQASDWAAYKVARQAMRYRQYQVAMDILTSLNLKVNIRLYIN